MKRIEKYINKTFEAVPNSEQKMQLMSDLITELSEKAEDLMNQGKSEEEAINETLLNFGEADELIASLKDEVVVYEKQSGAFGFSLWGSGLIVGLAVFINFYYTPQYIWFVYVLFAMIWWPLGVYYATRRKNNG